MTNYDLSQKRRLKRKKIQVICKFTDGLMKVYGPEFSVRTEMQNVPPVLVDCTTKFQAQAHAVVTCGTQLEEEQLAMKTLKIY